MMNLPGPLARRLLALIGGLALSVLAASNATAQGYPDRPITIIVGSAAGGSGDFIARVLAKEMSERLKQAVIVENKPGAGGNVSFIAGAKAPPDGYTLTLAHQALGVNPHLYPKMQLDPAHDFAPVSLVVKYYSVLAANPSSGVTSLPQLISSAKRQPNKIFYSSAGVGGSAHMATEVLMDMAGIQMTHVPYNGEARALTALVAGEVGVGFLTLSTAAPMVNAGKLVALAVTSPTRSPLYPSVPTVEEILPGYGASGWYGLVAPARTPPERVALLARTVREILQSPDIRSRISEAGFEVAPTTSAEFATFISAQDQMYSKLIKERNIKIEE